MLGDEILNRSLRHHGLPAICGFDAAKLAGALRRLLSSTPTRTAAGEDFK
jgi:hypothetical protein